MTSAMYNLSISYPSKRLNAGTEILAHVGYYVVLHMLVNGQWRLAGYSPDEFAETFRARGQQSKN